MLTLSESNLRPDNDENNDHGKALSGTVILLLLQLVWCIHETVTCIVINFHCCG